MMSMGFPKIVLALSLMRDARLAAWGNTTGRRAPGARNRRDAGLHKPKIRIGLCRPPVPFSSPTSKLMGGGDGRPRGLGGGVAPPFRLQR